MAAASSWAGLRPDLVCRIVRHFPCLAHRTMLLAVCRNWLRESPKIRLGPQLPWLLLPSSADASQDPCFFCLLCRTTHRAVLPDDVRVARCCGSFRRCSLILALQQTDGYIIHKLEFGWRILLPDDLGTPSPVDGHCMVVHAAGAGRSARDEDSKVTLPRGRSIADALYYIGHDLDGFHVLTDDEEILVYLPERAPDGALTMRLVVYSFPTHEVTPCAATRYLVKYADELLMVARIVTPDGWTRAFHAYKLVPELPPEQGGHRVVSWVPMHVIPSGIIVLGRCCSRSYPTYGIDFDGIYFLDDATSSEDAATRAREPAATRRYPCMDMGWLPLLEHKIKRIFPKRFPSESSRAVWVFHILHRVAFGAVCSSWRTVAADLANAKPVPRPLVPKELPWLLLPSAEAEVPVYFCIRCGGPHRAFLRDDVRTARCCGSYRDCWLVLALHNHQQQGQGGVYALHNIRTRKDIDVPGFLHTPDGGGAGGVDVVVLGAALSAVPTEDDACLALVLAQCASPIAFWCPGMEHLSPPMPLEPDQRDSWRDMLPGAQIADVIYFSGYHPTGFHVLTDAEEILVYTPARGPDNALATRLTTYRFPGQRVTRQIPGWTSSRYLLNLSSRLMMVVRYVSMTEDGEPDGTTFIETFWFSFIKMLQNGDIEASWVRFKIPNDFVAILGRCCSMTFPSPAVALNGLYFLDDADSFHGVMPRLLYPCTDMGMCTVCHPIREFTRVFPERPPSVFSPAVWFFHPRDAGA
ncbi:hypothetical protein QOZ80_2AG0111190 [Eleusine coracana subsp. coracana]|nr:hypothetical protein QOZ80_2AG0111190 [Eleusine coracana subsp. coracana]